MPIIPIARIIPCSINTTARLPIFIANISIYLQNRPCKLKNLGRKSNAYYIRITFLFQLSSPPIYIPTLFQYSSSSATSCSIHLFAYLEFIASFQVCLYTEQRENSPNCFVGSLFVIRYSVNFSTLCILLDRIGRKEISK